MDRIIFSFLDGGSQLSPLHAFEDVVPQDVQDLVAETNDAILAGEIVIPCGPKLSKKSPTDRISRSTSFSA